tara:strand:+ start:50 stop:385 length:336 start_codon:yes stop_codon:yes gene_type:complete
VARDAPREIINIFMINKRRVWREHAWTILSFPKQNKTILWNDNLKKYRIYDGLMKEDKPVKPPIPMGGMRTPKAMREYDLSQLKVICYIMAGALGATVTIILTTVILNKVL